MFLNYCLLLLAVSIANVNCKVVEYIEEEATKADKVSSSNEEFGPSRAFHENKFMGDQMPRTTIIEESIIIKNTPYQNASAQTKPELKNESTQTTPEAAENGAVIGKDKKRSAASNKNSVKSSEEKDKKEKNNSGMFDSLWVLLGITPSIKKVEIVNKEIVRDDTNTEEVKEKLEKKNKEREWEKTIVAFIQENGKTEKSLPQSKKKDTVLKKNQSETKNRYELEEKNHKKKSEKSDKKKDIPTHKKKQNYSEDYSRMLDELIKSDIVDSAGSSESSSSEENEKQHAGQKNGYKRHGYQHRHNSEGANSGFIHFGVVKTLALITAGPALIIAVVVLLSRADIKKRESTMM